jgi:hypothetical protein
MNSAYKDRVECLRKLDTSGKGLRAKQTLEKENQNAEESIKIHNHFLEKWMVGKEMDDRYAIKKAEENISGIKKESASKLKKDLAGITIFLENAKKKLKETEKEKKQHKKDITALKNLIVSNTKKIKKLKKGTDKCYERERKGDTGKKRARCPNGTRKNNNSGKCENK